MGSRKFISALLAGVGLASSTGAPAAEEPLTLKPSSDWVLDYAENSCALRRAFGDGPQKVFLELDNFALWDNFRVTIMSEGIEFNRKEPRTRFEPDKKLRSHGDVLYGVFAEGREGILYTDNLMQDEQLDQLRELARQDLPPVPWSDAERDERERQVTALYIGNSFDRDLRLETGSLHAPMEAMRTCITDLMTHLGIDAEKTHTLSRPVMAKHAGTWVRQFINGALSSELMHKGRTSVQVRLIVDEQGEAVNCYSRDEGQDEIFNRLSCERLIKLAEFDPALDAEGRPVRAAWVTRIRYLP